MEEIKHFQHGSCDIEAFFSSKHQIGHGTSGSVKIGELTAVPEATVGTPGYALAASFAPTRATPERIAVKEMKLSNDAPAMEMICRELMTISRLSNHTARTSPNPRPIVHVPNIVAIHCVNNSNAEIKIAMELMEGSLSVNSRSQRGHPSAAAAPGLGDTSPRTVRLGPNHRLAPVMSEDALRFVTTCVLSGLSCLHNCNLVHNDLKPANLLYGYDIDNGRRSAPTVKLCDFGSCDGHFVDRPTSTSDDGVSSDAASAFGTTKAKAVIGTGVYMAPERTRTDAYNDRADMWALGLTLVELAAGLVESFGLILANALLRRMNLSGLPDPSSNVKVCYAAMSDINHAHLVTEWPAVCREIIVGVLSGDPEVVAPTSHHCHHETYDIPSDGFIDFVVSCLSLEHNLRPGAGDLLPWIVDGTADISAAAFVQWMTATGA